MNFSNSFTKPLFSRNFCKGVIFTVHSVVGKNQINSSNEHFTVHSSYIFFISIERWFDDNFCQKIMATIKFCNAIKV